MELNDEEKTILGYQGLEAFAAQFGENDIFKQIMLDIILEGIYGETVHLPGETGQEGDQNPVGDERTMPADEIE